MNTLEASASFQKKKIINDFCLIQYFNVEDGHVTDVFL